MKKVLALGFVLAMLTSVACGGGSGSGDGGIFWSADGSSSCGSFSPCGGSVVGTWSIASLCVATTADAGTFTASGGCTVTRPDGLPYRYSGSLTFNANGTYTTSVSMSGSATLTYSAGCFSGTYNCSAVGAAFTSAATADAGVSGSCVSVSSTGECACTERFNTPMTVSNGTYTTSGTTITSTGSSTSSSSSPSTSNYCVQGKTLKISSSSPMGSSSTLVLTR